MVSLDQVEACLAEHTILYTSGEATRRPTTVQPKNCEYGEEAWRELPDVAKLRREHWKGFADLALPN